MEEAKSLDRALRLLFELARSPEGVSVSELARRLNTQRPPLYRPLQTLAKYRIVHKDEGKLYHLGVGLLELAEAAAGSIANEARPILQAGADELSNTVMLVVEEGEAIVTLASVRPSTPGIYLDTPPGFIHPEGPTAPRLAIQALDGPSPGEDRGVALAREHGYALTRGIATEGRTAVAVGLFLGASRRPGALLVVGDDSMESGEGRVVEVLPRLARSLAAQYRTI